MKFGIELSDSALSDFALRRCFPLALALANPRDSALSALSQSDFALAITRIPSNRENQGKGGIRMGGKVRKPVLVCNRLPFDCDMVEL